MGQFLPSVNWDGYLSSKGRGEHSRYPTRRGRCHSKQVLGHEDSQADPRPVLFEWHVQSMRTKLPSAQSRLDQLAALLTAPLLAVTAGRGTALLHAI